MNDREFLKKKLENYKEFLNALSERYDVNENEDLFDHILDAINETKKQLEELNNGE